MKDSHSKVKDIKYTKFEIQQYLTSSKFTFRQSSLLFKLRTRTANFKSNTPSQFGDDPIQLQCPLKCLPIQPDTQEHLLQCTRLQSLWNKNNAEEIPEYTHLFGSIDQQHRVTLLYQKLIEAREQLITQDERKNTQPLHL